MKRSAFKRRLRAEGPTAPRETKPWASALVSATLKPLARGSYAGGTAAPAPKTEAYRDPTLLEMARGRPCLLMIPGLCSHRVDTVVAAHSNLSVHGKGGARKADDCYSCWACAACHVWLDTSKALAAIKEVAFMNGHARQVLAWRLIAMDASEPERFRAAARRALEKLNEETP